MKGVKFGNYHSFNDFSLILGSKVIAPPSAKTEIIELPGADGVLDLSEYFGGIKFSNRKLTFNFSTIVPQSQFIQLFSEIQNAIHGQKFNIILDDDPDFYYVGRVTINEWLSNKNIGRIVIECDCEPYKYKIYETVFTQTITDNVTMVFPNLRKHVVPTITVTAETTIVFEGVTYSLSAGTYTDASIVFGEGNNTMTVSGNTVITVKYREGAL